MGDEGLPRHRLALFIVFLALGFCIFAVPNYIAGAARNAYEVGLTIVLAIFLLAVWKTKRTARFAPIIFTFFVAALAFRPPI